MCPTRWCQIGSGDQPLPSCFPTTFLHAQERAQLPSQYIGTWGASEAELSRKEDFPLSLGKDGCGGKPSPLPTDIRMGEQTPPWKMGLCMTPQHLSRNTVHVVGQLWRDQKSPEQMAPCHFSQSGGFGLVFLLYTKSLVLHSKRDLSKMVQN